MASFIDSFDEPCLFSHPIESTHSFQEINDYVAVGGFSTFDSNRVKYSTDEFEIFNDHNDDIYGFYDNNAVFVDSDDMQEEGFVLREWHRQNAIQLKEKEKREKAILRQIIEEASEYKVVFHEKRKVKCENNKINNREKEKLFVHNLEKFHKEAYKNYWEAIAELIPNEVPSVEKKRGKKDDEKKPAITVIQGPKPGKPTDLARMRQMLVKLKDNAPTHLKLAASVDVKVAGLGTEPPQTTAVAAEAVVVA